MTLAALERHAGIMTALLDDHLGSLSGARRDLADHQALIAGERELFSIEGPLNENLQKVYQLATDGRHSEHTPILVRTALLHWTVLLRRRTMRGFHTAVDGLGDDTDCRGDMIADGLLVRYFDALFEHRDKAVSAAVAALTNITRQTACLGAQQSAQLASDLYWSFAELRGFLRLNGIEQVLPYVVQAAVAPLLLFYDVEKYRGLQAPLTRWFQEHREWILGGIANRRLPVFWHGLWLYDRRSGRLIGYRPSLNPQNENEVHLGAFFTSIILRENLGNFDCTFAEMVERGLGTQGYVCAGSLCVQSDSSASKQNPAQTLERWRNQASRTNGAPLGTVGFSAEVTANTICGQTGGAGGRNGNTDGGTGICGNGVSGLGRDWAARVVDCITSQVVRPGMKQMRCVAEAMGLCSDPVDKLVKELQETTFAGVKTGRNCGLAKGANGSSPTPWDTYQATRDAADKAYDRMNQLLQQTMHDKVQDLIDSQKARDAAAKAYQDDPTDANKQALDKAEAQVDSDEDEVNDYQDYIRQTLEAEAKKRDERKQQAEDTYNQQTGSNKRCPPDTPDCGGDDCTAMSRAMAETMKCFEDDALREDIDSFGQQPGVTDPVEPDNTNAPSWTRCLSGFNDDLSLPKQCWAYDCGAGGRTGFTAGGLCSCDVQVEGEPRETLAGTCDQINCGDSRPVVKDGRCTCVGSEGTWGQTPPGPSGPFMPSPPQLFLETRLGDYNGLHGDSSDGPPFDRRALS